HRNIGADVDYERDGVGDHRLVQTERQHCFHRVHCAHFRGLCDYLVLLERSELGENTCPANLNSFSVQREWLGPLPDNGTHYDFFGGDAGGFSSYWLNTKAVKAFFRGPRAKS